MLAFRSNGDFSKAEGFLNKLRTANRMKKLDTYAQKGVDALSAATPKNTGKTASSWYAKIEQGDDYAKIIWCNSNKAKDGSAIAFLIQNGHGTRNGGYVPPIDYINPAMAPVFDEITENAWEEVKGR